MKSSAKILLLVLICSVTSLKAKPGFQIYTFSPASHWPISKKQLFDWSIVVPIEHHFENLFKQLGMLRRLRSFETFDSEDFGKRTSFQHKTKTLQKLLSRAMENNFFKNYKLYH